MQSIHRYYLLLFHCRKMTHDRTFCLLDSSTRVMYFIFVRISINFSSNLHSAYITICSMYTKNHSNHLFPFTFCNLCLVKRNPDFSWLIICNTSSSGTNPVLSYTVNKISASCIPVCAHRPTSSLTACRYRLSARRRSARNFLYLRV